jgi:hypothetical protein
MEKYAAFMRQIKNGSKILVRKVNGNRHIRRFKCLQNNKKRVLKEHNVRKDSLAYCRIQL